MNAYGEDLPPGGAVRIAIEHLTIVPGAVGRVPVTLGQITVGGLPDISHVWCIASATGPRFEADGSCRDASVAIDGSALATSTPTATPPPLPSPTATVPVPTIVRGISSIAIDCDVARAGIQTQCTISGSKPFDVGVVVVNQDPDRFGLHAFNFELRGPLAKAIPVDRGLDTTGDYDANPSLAASPRLGWALLPGPYHDCLNAPPRAPLSNPCQAPTTAGEFSSFISGYGGLAPLPPGGATTAALVHLAVTPGATGLARLHLVNGSAADALYQPIADCNPNYDTNAVCADATIQFVPCPDVDGNGYVTSSDLLRVARDFGTTRGQTAYDPHADVSGNGFVNSSDLLLTAGSFGQRC